MKKSFLTIIAIITITISSLAQNVNIPDYSFKSYLLSRTDSINTDSDKNNISKIEANSFKGQISIYSTSGCKSLIGIEEFTNLTSLRCNNNNISVLDISKNIKLLHLECGENQLTILNVTNNVLLNYLSCGLNRLQYLDLSNNTLLTYLECVGNQLTNLDISKNTALTWFFCNANQLTSLDVTKNTDLSMFNCSYNPNLTCIQALNTQDKTYWYNDNTAQYNENCNYVTDINNDENLTQPKKTSSIYNLQGQSVNNTYKGLVIIRYTDGTSEKVIQ